MQLFKKIYRFYIGNKGSKFELRNVNFLIIFIKILLKYQVNTTKDIILQTIKVLIS